MSETRHTVDPKFVMNRQGKDMVLFAGLVDAAHRAGLLGIATEVIQFPNQDNGQTVIVKAVATFPLDWIESPETGNPIAVGARQFSGIGDANTQNVGKNIAPHFIRMAETRAKARALRDALNVGMVTVEELGDDDGHAASQPRPQNRPQQQGAPAGRPQDARNAAARPSVVAEPPSPLTNAQHKAIADARDMPDAGVGWAAVREYLKPFFDAATKPQKLAIKAEMDAIQAKHYPGSLTQQEG